MLFKSSFCSPPHFPPTFCFIASSISLPPGSQPSWPALSRAHKHIFCDVCQLPGLAWLTLAQLRLQFSVDQCWAVWPHWNNQMVPSLFQAFPGSPEQQAPPPPDILAPQVSRWLFLPGLEGPERGQSGLARKWEPYRGYLLFHLSPPFALACRGPTDV